MDNSRDILRIAKLVAEDMPNGWTAIEPDYDGTEVWLRGPDRIELHISHYQGRFEIAGRTTSDEIRQREQGDERPKAITVSANKLPQQIARDITRRLLPDHVSYVAVLRARVQRHNDYEARVRALRDELLTALGGAGRQAQGSDNEIYLCLADGYGTMTISGASVSFSRLSVPREIAMEIARVLAEGGKRP